MIIFSKYLKINRCTESSETSGIYSLSSLPKNGWYMFEVYASSSVPAIECTITLSTITGRHLYPLKLYSGQVSKRILRIKNILSISLSLKNEIGKDTNIQSVKVTRLAYPYAKKLVIKKLILTHPRYQLNSQKQNIKDIRFSLLWRHYCAVFYSKKYILSYIDWINEFDAGSQINFSFPFIPDQALDVLPDEWVIFLDTDCVLSRNFSKYVKEYIGKFNGYGLIYTDSDLINENGNRTSPQFNSDWDRDLFYSRNYLSGLVIINRRIIDQLAFKGFYLKEHDSYERILFCLDFLSDSDVFHIPRIMFHRYKQYYKNNSESDNKPAILACLNNHFQRNKIQALAKWNEHALQVQYTIPEIEPLVSIIIPTRNQKALLQKCLSAIINKTEYTNYEIILVDNGSDEQDALDYLAEVARIPKIKILSDSRPFNYSALNNYAVHFAKGEILALLNNDVEVINKNWLNEMVGHALRPEVGAVGAKLYYPNDTIQHAGVIIGLSGCADHLFRGLARNEPGYQMRAMLTQAYSAVTGACLIVRKSYYQQVGGLNEQDLPVAFNDIDLCLKLRAAGYRTIWCPHAELYHHESVSRGIDDTPEKKSRSKREVAYMIKQWSNLMPHDPAYNPNLSLLDPNCNLAWPPRIPI